MLLTIHNLPAKYRYSDVKGLLVEKCGLAELILDNLVLEGTTKKVTVGVADEGDAAVLVRKVNGLYVDGLQLYVEDARKKRPGSEQPFRSTKEYKLSQEAQHQPHYGQATMMPSQMQPQYADPQAYMSQNPVLHTNSLAMQSPYMNTQPIMQGYGMAAGIDMVPQLCSQDNSMVGYQADDLPYQSGGLSDVPAQQPNWAAQNTNNQHWDQGQEYQKWSNSQQKNWDQDRSEQNQWVRNRSRSRSPARERSRHDTRSDSRRGKKSKQLTWEPRQGAKKDWHGRDGNAGTGYRRPPSPQRQRFSPQRRETSLQQPVDFNAREFRGNPDYLARHAPPEMLQQYEPDRNYSYEDLYQPTSSDPFEREDNDFPPNPAYFEPQDHPTPYGDHVKRPRDRRRSRSGDRSRPCFEGSSQSFRKRDERESWSDRKRPAPDRHEQFPNRAREHEFGAQDRRVQFPKRARENEFGAQDNRAGDRVYPVDKGKPGSKVAPGDYIPMRDRTWRAQTVSQIAKANALNETAKVVKYYKRAVSAKLDKLMRDEVNVSTSDMFLRYMQLHNDKKLLNACRRQVEMELKASSEERTADVEAALAGEKFKGAPAAKPNPKAGKPQPTGPKQQPNGPKTQPTTKKNSNNTAVSGRIPNYPAGDKQIFEDAKKAMQMEFAGEMTYSLDAPEDQALESDLDNITMLIKENCGASGEEPSPDDNYVAKSADAIADELRTDGEIEGTQPSLATQPYPLENLAKLLQGHDEMNPKDSLYDLTDVMPSLAREPQTSKTLECEPPTIDETLEGQTTEKYAQISDQKRKKRRKRKKRSGVPRNGGSWKEWGRLPSCKSLKCLQAREGTGNVNEQDQAEQEVETQQGNQSGVGKNIRERNKKIVRKDNKLVQAEPSFVKPKEPKQFEEKMKTLELHTNIPEVDHDEFVTIDEVKLEDKLCDQNDLTDRMPSQVFKPQLSEGLASQPQPLESLTNQSQLFEYLANHPQIFEYLATHPKVLKSLSNQPQLLECSVSKIEQRDLETLCVTIGNDRLVLNMLSLYRHILGQTDSDEDEYSISVDETELGEIKPFESLTNQLQPSESLTSQVSSVASQSQPVDGLISQPQPFESLRSEQPIESLVRVIDLTQLQTLKGPVTQSKLSQYLENQPQVSEHLANQPQLFESLANLQQIFECMPNRPQIFQYLANQPQLFQCLANQPQLFEYLTSQPQLLEYLANHPYPLQYLLSKVRVWDKNTLLETIDNDRSIMIAMSDQLKPKWRRKRKRRGAKRNRGSKTERGRWPSYRRRKKNDENSEEQHMKVNVEASGDTNNNTGKGINEEESHLDQDVKTELSSYSQDEGEELRMKKRRSSDEEVCGGNQQSASKF